MTGSDRVKRLRRNAKRQAAVQLSLSQKALGYVRVSTDEQAAAGYGLEAQEHAIRAFAESQGYELLDVILDSGVSGSTRPSDRPGFARVMELADEQAFSILLVWKFDRLARSLEYAVTTVNGMQEHYGIVLRSVTEPIDTATPMGQTIFAVLAGFAAQERMAITQRTLIGKREKAKKGGFVGGAAPLGYKRDRDGGLIIDEDEAETVRKIYELREDGQTLQAIADVMNRESIPTKRGRRWYPGTVRYVLDNPKYKGLVEYYFRWDGEEHILQQGQHEPILSQAQ